MDLNTNIFGTNMWYDQTVLIGCTLTLMQLVQKTPLLSQLIALKRTAAN